MGGMWMFGVLGADLFTAIVLACFGMVAVGTWFLGRGRLAARAFAILGFPLAALPLAVGAVGWRWNVALVEAAVQNAAPEMRDLILAQGGAEAIVPLWFGLGSSVLAGVAALVVLVLAIPSGRSSDPDEADA